MGKCTDEVNDMRTTQATPGLSRMLTLELVQEILNVRISLVCALVRSGEVPAAQFGVRGIWRVREGDLAAYIGAPSPRLRSVSPLDRFPRITSPTTTDEHTLDVEGSSNQSLCPINVSHILCAS